MIRYDYKPIFRNERHPKSKSKILLFFLGFIVISALVVLYPRSNNLTPTSPANKTLAKLPNLELQPIWHNVKVETGDNLAKIFSRLKLSSRELHCLMQTKSAKRNLKHIQPGQSLRIRTSANGTFNALALDISPAEAIYYCKNKDESGFYSKKETKPIDTRLVYTANTINDSLFLAAQRSGLTDKLIMNLVEIFGWDIDFALDIRASDSFHVLYEERYVAGTKIKLGTGNILAAEFTNQNRTFKAIRYTDQNGFTGYYTPQGMSMQQAFIRTPVKFTRISSRFNLHRRHPVLHKIRAHRGVDYAAPRGTPVKATSDGKIKFIGRKGGYGNFIVLQHGKKYSTAYAHLSRYAKGMRRGRRVSQGQIIGYVGSTGLASGPHLHYEFRINGVHHNPLTVKMPKIKSIAKREKNKFKGHTKKMLALLDNSRPVQVARAK